MLCVNAHHNVQIPTFRLQTAAKGIAPGTLWCGLDDIATEYSSLGSDQELDK